MQVVAPNVQGNRRAALTCAEDQGVNRRIRLTVRLGGDSQRRAKKLRREVRAVGPHQCPKLWVDLKSEKEVTVPQRLKYRTVDLIGEIHFVFYSIAETKPKYIASDVTSVNQMWNHCSLQRFDSRQRLAGACSRPEASRSS